MHVLYIGETAKTQWQNEYDDELNIVCPDKQGFYRVVSQYYGMTRDRQWQWDCREVTKTTKTNCFFGLTVWRIGGIDLSFFDALPTTYLLGLIVSTMMLMKIDVGNSIAVMLKTVLLRIALLLIT